VYWKPVWNIFEGIFTVRNRPINPSMQVGR